MPALRTKIVGVAVTLVACSLLLSVAGLCWIEGGSIAGGVTLEELLALRPGTREETVLRQLGEPLTRRKSYRVIPTGSREDPWGGAWFFIYGEPARYCNRGPEITLGVRDHVLRSVTVEEGDMAIYVCDDANCGGLGSDAEQRLQRLIARR